LVQGETSSLTSPGAEPSRRGRILVIDDEPAVGRTLQRLLGREHEVTVLSDAHQALDLFAEGAEFDMIICDLTMPDLSGIDLYELCQTRRPDLASRFVFMTGGTFTPSSREFLDSLATACIEKPFDLHTIRNLVQSRIG
jgi:DNA-binding NtrC family response regulator